MNPDCVVEEKERLIQRFGPWTADNVHLGGGVYTLDRAAPERADILRRLMQVVQDIAHRPLPELRVLDLACLEGLYGIELALHGAKVVGIEGRQANIEKARFVKQTLGLAGLELVQDDVRNISAEKFGQFDAILCAGILYHLDAPDVFHFIERIFEMTTGFAVFDTQISLAARAKQTYKNRRYSGRFFTEHGQGSAPDEKEQRLWSSVDNDKSFWFTKPSLLNFLAHTGFTSVYECHNPSTPQGLADRVTLVAMKGIRRPLLCSPLLNERLEQDWPEKLRRQTHECQQVGVRRLATAVALSTPASARRLVKKLVGGARRPRS
jgi:2-polyprenyl-3-methyl-5-hydroxy-6-metoxy-1,4-benzoquinol methylase